MQRTIICILIAGLTAGYNTINSQSVSIKESIDSINALLKANPYVDGFNNIEFYNSVNISPEKELVVEMSFDGPFRWVYRVRISELDLSPKNDICSESPSSICWICKKTAADRVNSCIKAEMIFADGKSETENASNICISFSRRSNICNDLNNRFILLFEQVMNDDR